MDFIINAIQMYEETDQDYENFPYSPKSDSNGVLQEDYAIIIVPKEIYELLQLTEGLHLKITTYYGSIIINPQIDSTIPKKCAILPLSPWIYLITPPRVLDIEEDQIEHNNVKPEYNSKRNNEPLNETEKNPNMQLEQLDFSTSISFHAKVEPTNDPITTYSQVLDGLMEKTKNQSDTTQNR